MKKAYAVLMIVFFTLKLSAQLSSYTPDFYYQDYNEKSKKQKTWAWILTGSGAALLLSGLIVYNSEQSYFPNQEVGTALMIGGGAAITGGIILFTAAARNKKEVSLQLKGENTIALQRTGARKKYIPALSFQVKL